MVGVRAPERLEAGALCAWLRALDTAVGRGEGVHAPLRAPPALLTAALNQGAAGLREAVLARLAVAAVAAGVSRLEVHLEHPTLIEALLEALSAHSAHITSLLLTLGPRTVLRGSMCVALRNMTCLTSLTLTPAATDAHLAALAVAAPPLETLDVSYCTAVTDKGMRALLGVAGDTRTMREVMDDGYEGGGQGPAATLHTLNLWGTEVTTRGCVLLLSVCPALSALTCRWSEEALDLMVRAGRETPLALSQLLLAEVPLPPLAPVASLCPLLTSLVARRPSDSLSVGQVLEAVPSLTALTLVQFLPVRETWFPANPVPYLTYLHLSLLDPRPIHLSHLAVTCPALTHLYLEGVTPMLTSPYPPVPSSKLGSLRIMTLPTISQVIDPEVVVWAVVWACGASSIDLGSCKHLTDQHLSQALDRGALFQVEDLRLSGATQVTEEGIDNLVMSCPRLRRLALKMLPKDRLAQLESLKVKIRQQNLDLELITYGWKF
ncbi:hypothetical protein OTU49_005735 [Cherax quadricarinatus]|uniref:Uncharacterized protein n=1 Tax=Cherax quadricarinatus TaxID=27406 RepID=A0AAW0X6B8_CHEQU|nr:LOW QUALITY PROTEIN: uncharacterized protein LOC128697018 [Cherax quadricarinatus]